ncbi:hypothetical protein D3Z58_03185 [Clostridiaceae bacterium]|nr:hypothetical protein [Clostridiaceae bacterium]
MDKILPGSLRRTSTESPTHISNDGGEEGKNYLDRESEKTGSGKKVPEFVEYTKVYQHERIAKFGDSFW